MRGISWITQWTNHTISSQTSQTVDKDRPSQRTPDHPPFSLSNLWSTSTG